MGHAVGRRPTGSDMPLVYVVKAKELDAAPADTVYALLLPRDGQWAELAVVPSTVDAGGFGVRPARGELDWSCLRDGKRGELVRVLMPYLGNETVAHDERTLKLLHCVLRGDFVTVNAREAREALGAPRMWREGICAEPEPQRGGGGGARSRREPLDDDELLLQIADSCDCVPAAEATGGAAKASGAYYVIREDARRDLNLCGARSHLWDLLEAHERHHHADRHLATHVVDLHRKEEGHVIVNAHPAFAEPDAIVGLINEPLKDERPNVQMVQGYCTLLESADPRLTSRGLRQPPDAHQLWDATMRAPVGHPRHGIDLGTKCDAPRVSELMTMYVTGRERYEVDEELTVSYGENSPRSRRDAISPHPHTPPLKSTSRFTSPRRPPLPSRLRLG